MMEIAPGIYQIPGTVGARPLSLYLLLGKTRTILVDTGTATDPEALIVPYLDSLGLAAAPDLVINTHADADHVGGNAVLKRLKPQLAITCGQADRRWIEDPGRMITERYGAYRTLHDIGPDEATHRWYVDMLGDPQAVDWTWVGGESLRLGPDWVVEIYSTPGHSAGHLTIFDPRSRTALMGDAVHGGIGRDTLGNPTYPAYTHVEPYLSSIETLRRLDPEFLAGCHWPVMRGPEIEPFLRASVEYVQMLDDALCTELAVQPQGATLHELVQAIGPKWSGGHAVWDLELGFTFAANLDRLVERQIIVQDAQTRPVRYAMAKR